MESTTIGIDIGGSHITAALADMQSKSIIKNSRVRRYVNSKGSAEEIISDWCNAIRETGLHQQHGKIQIGIAMPGPFDYEQGISFIKDLDKYEALYNLNVKEMIAENLNINASQIKMLNDAACFLQGEAFAGAGENHEKLIGLTLGTGVGTARYKDGLAEDAQLWCSPFLDSIAENYLSTKWFLKRYNELCGSAVPDVKSLADIYESSQPARLVFDEFAHNLASFVLKFIQTDQPEAVILGGNIANAEPYFLAYLKNHLASHQVEIPIYKAVLNEEAAILGAASLWSSLPAPINNNA